MVIEIKKRVENLRKSKSGNQSDKCEVTDCTEDPKRAVSYKKIKDALPDLKFDRTGKRVHLCKEHYKKYKKATKAERTLETLTWD